MSGQVIVDELKRLAARAGVLVEPPTADNGHFKLKGALLVHYYPLSANRTAYVNGTTKGHKHVTPKQAIAMCMQQPEIAPENRKDKRAANSRKIRYRLLKGRKEVPCHWCKTMIDLDTSTIEHVIPLDRGGLDNDNNRTLACEPCNRLRGNSMPELKEKK